MFPSIGLDTTGVVVFRRGRQACAKCSGGIVGRRISGEFSPPRELVAMGAARVTGRGVVHVSADGLTVEGTIFGAGPQISPWASLLVLLCGLCISAFVPHAERVLTPATVLVVGGIIWLRYRSEFGQSGTFA